MRYRYGLVRAAPAPGVAITGRCVPAGPQASGCIIDERDGPKLGMGRVERLLERTTADARADVGPGSRQHDRCFAAARQRLVAGEAAEARIGRSGRDPE